MSVASDRQRSRIGWWIVALVFTVAVGRAMTVGFVAPPNRLSEPDVRAVGQAAAALEPTWRTESRRSFPGDAWSQDDDYSARERKWALDEARRRGVPVSDVLAAIDAELRASAPIRPPRDPSAAPSKPRPFYD